MIEMKRHAEKSDAWGGQVATGMPCQFRQSTMVGKGWSSKETSYTKIKSEKKATRGGDVEG